MLNVSASWSIFNCMLSKNLNLEFWQYLAKKKPLLRILKYIFCIMTLEMQRHGLADTFKQIYYPRLFIKKKTIFTTWFPFFIVSVCSYRNLLLLKWAC